MPLTLLSPPQMCRQAASKNPQSSVQRLLSSLCLLLRPQPWAASSSCFSTAGFCLKGTMWVFFPLGLILPFSLKAAFGGSLVSNSDPHEPVLSHPTQFFLLGSQNPNQDKTSQTCPGSQEEDKAFSVAVPFACNAVPPLFRLLVMHLLSSQNLFLTSPLPKCL